MVVGPATLPADAQIVTIRVSVHLRPSWYCASHCWVPGTPGIALTNKEASYSQVTGGVVGPDKLSARNWLAFWRSVSWIIRRIKLRTKPRKGTRQSYQNPPASQAEFHWLRGYVDG